MDIAQNHKKLATPPAGEHKPEHNRKTEKEAEIQQENRHSGKEPPASKRQKLKQTAWLGLEHIGQLK